MKLVLIIGDSAVGKMTVGQELMKITDLRLFHNHMTIEPSIEIFGHFEKELTKMWRDDVFEVFSKSNQYGLIFTYMWAFDMASDWKYMDYVCEIFKKQDAEIYAVELIADLPTRLERNKTENRLKHKASKRDLKLSEERLLNDYYKYRFISNEGELSAKFEHYLKISTEHLKPEDVALKIKDTFNL